MFISNTPIILVRISSHVALLSPNQCPVYAPDVGNVDLDLWSFYLFLEDLYLDIIINLNPIYNMTFLNLTLP
jgi:hypothetical protein